MDTSTTLDPQNRSKLDGIVQKMQQNKESDAYIQNVVNDFKTKYGKAPTPPTAPDAKPGLLQSIGNGITKFKQAILPTELNIGTGILKGAGELAANTETLLQRPKTGLMAPPAPVQPQKAGLLDKLVSKAPKLGPPSPTLGEKAVNSGMFNPSNKVQGAAKTAADLAFLFAPVPGLEEAAGTSLVGKMATQGLEFGAKSTIQKGKVDGDVRTDALIAAAFPAIGAASKLAAPSVGSALNSASERIFKTLIKPSASDLEKGFKIENVKKYDIGGNLKQMLTKTNNVLNDTYSELQGKLGKAAQDPKAQVDVGKVFTNTVDRIKSGRNLAKQFGSNQAIERIINEVSDETKMATNGSLKANLLDATSIKQGAGTKGAWSFGFADPDATARELVYDTFYNEMKKEIESVGKSAGIPDIAELNRKMGDLIPIKSALIKRMPVDDRRAVIGLKPALGILGAIFNPKALALMGADTLLRSGNFAEFLGKAGERLKGLPDAQLGPTAKRFFGPNKTVDVPKASAP